jgi:hypothetical protein
MPRGRGISALFDIFLSFITVGVVWSTQPVVSSRRNTFRDLGCENALRAESLADYHFPLFINPSTARSRDAARSTVSSRVWYPFAWQGRERAAQ